MNKYLFVLFFTLFVLFETKAQTFIGVEPITSFYDEYNVIESGGYVFAAGDAILINQNSVIKNNGKIEGNIDLNGNNLNVTNSGIIDGTIINNSGSKSAVLQNISNDSEFKNLQIGSNIDLSVDIRDINNLSVDKLKNLNAQHYIIKNSDIYIDDLSDWNNWNTDILFSGVNNLYIASSGEFVRYVENMQNVNIELQEKPDNLHKIVLTKTNSGVAFNIVRETDYSKVFNDERGFLLEKLRGYQKDKNFINLIDSANSMQDIENIMNLSYHFNHKFLMRPLYVNNGLSMLDFISEESKTEINFNANYTGGNKISGFGGKANINGEYDNLFFGIGLNINELNYKNHINNFDVVTFSPELKLGFNKDNFWVKGKTGFSFAEYKADNIYYNNDIVNDPHGRSYYSILNFGYDFDIDKDLKIGAFTGADYQFIKVLDIKNTDINLHVGSKIKYSYELIGIKYELSGTAAINTNNDLMGSFELGCFSVLDEIGAYIKFNAYRNQYDLNYQASINAKLTF